MTEELVSSLGLEITGEELSQLLSRERSKMDEHRWVDIFADILVRLNEGKQISDLGLHALPWFLSSRPFGLKTVFRSDGTFSLKVDGRKKSMLELPSKTLGALITTRPHYASAILEGFSPFTRVINDEALERHLTDGWFASMFNAIIPSKLPFTNEFIPLHKHLVKEMSDCLFKIQNDDEWREIFRSQSQLNELYLSLHKITRNYVIHLSLHPFACVPKFSHNPVLDFLTHFFGPDLEDSVTKPFREQLRKDMDEAALSSSSPPFILTSDLVCRLTDDEIMNVVDRIVALLESDFPISDDTILRICAFHTNQLKCVYLPELFRKAGRSTEQYFHALNSLISVPLDYFDLHRINSLLTSRPDSLQPTLDEWDDVDLSTVGIMMPTINRNSVTVKSASSQLLDFTKEILPQLSHCASRLTLSQIERLLAPTINVLSEFYNQQNSSEFKFRKDRAKVFIELSRLCEQRVIAQCLGRIGFFSRIVDGLLDDSTFNASKCFINIFLRQTSSSGNEATKIKTLRRRAYHFLEEGWQNVLEILFFRQTTQNRFSDQLSRMMGVLNYGLNPERDRFPQLGHIVEMMDFCGANLNGRMY
ncbi:hypothetical protein BLNAU_3083 [Blattamonas nauphoetae]|uniref:Uncharacterized protein n=1 Tax=Blattamonas nauphoetae TaxID=2049346 RepID=A0ABQ9YE36_9EUKA|nr:hypothetical protein BLNAU_3083 [Blattamonas nauphoetae]